MTDTYDDDRPGMMRVHIAQQRGEVLAAKYTITQLRSLARKHNVDLSWSDGTKPSIGAELAMVGVKP